MSVAKRVQFRGGTTTSHQSFTGAEREITIDTTKKTVIVHDGLTPGGHPIAKEIDFNNHINDSLNPHGVTKVQVGLGNVNNTADSNKSVLSATKWTTARTIALIGDVTGSASFDGSANASITTTVADDSHNHVISNVDGLQSALDSKAPLANPTFTGTPKIETDNITSISTAVSDNAIARYDGTTGKLQNSGVIIDDNGNVGIGLANPHAKLGAVHNTTDATGTNNNTTGCSIAIDASGATNPLLGLRWTNDRVGIGGANYSSQLVADSANSLALEIYTTGSSPLVFGTNSDERMRIDTTGNLLLTSGTGALGYGAGAGGTVTQLTSKGTAVALNKPTGVIILSNQALAAGASVLFILHNAFISLYDAVLISIIDDFGGHYEAQTILVYQGYCIVRVMNKTVASRSEAIRLSYSIIKGANS